MDGAPSRGQPPDCPEEAEGVTASHCSRSNSIYYRTFRAPANPPDVTEEQQQERHFFPDSMQVEVGPAMMVVDNPELGTDLTKLREGTVEVKMSPNHQA